MGADRPDGLCPRCLLALGIEGASTAGPGAPIPSPSTGIPDRIGPYRILEPLGEGGMGIVYLAEQTEPLRRRVALKVIKPGMDSRQVLARFEAERQALAIMSHPNVAKVFDAGATEQGRPYFVMEYVPGIPLTEYCDMHCLPLRERLALFIAACEAIQHAHQKGIIHRDIKPTNFLVASEAGKPVLKVIDFGVAKAMGPQLTDLTLFTRHGVLLGTPEYMSPEQAGMSSPDVDARTDIYSLGVVLYELLVGALPFDAATLRRAAAVEMMRILREEEPPRPTTKFSSLGDSAPEVARHRHTDVHSLARQVHGELEWITMRALEKDPARRYPSASELAADVQRHLADEPVFARRPSRTYLLKKFARKHMAAVAALAASLVVLVAGVLVSTAMYVRSEAARASAETEAARNRIEAEALQAALRQDSRAYAALSAKAVELHRRALGPGNPALASYLVNHIFVAQSLIWDLQPDMPNAWLREALGLIESGLDAGDVSAVRTLILLSDYGSADQQEMARLQAKAFELVRRKAGSGDAQAAQHLDLLADLLEKVPATSNPEVTVESAERTLREVMALRRKAHPNGGPELSRSLVALSGLLVQKAHLLEGRTDSAGAEAAYREAMSLASESGSGSELRSAEIASALGRFLRTLGRLKEAEPLLLDSLRIIRAEIPDDRSSTVQETLNRLVDLYVSSGKPLEAARYRRMLPPISVAGVRDMGLPLYSPKVRERTTGSGASLSGRAVWIFQDTVTAGGGAAPLRSLDSSWGFVQPPGGRAPWTLVSPTDSAGTPLALIPRMDEEANQDAMRQREDCTEAEICDSRWSLTPGAAIWDGARGRALIFYTKSLRRRDEKGGRIGTSIAVWTDLGAPAVRPILRPAAAEPTLLFDADEPPWGSAALVDGDSLYVYACQGPAGHLESPCLLARVPLDRVLDRGAWRFHAGEGAWSADWRAARPVVDQLAPLSVHWNAYLGKYLAIGHMPLSARIAIHTADRPEGPWSPWSESLLVEGLPPPGGWPWIRSGLGHPELSREGGRVETLTYVRWDGESGDETRVLEVELRKQESGNVPYSSRGIPPVAGRRR